METKGKIYLATPDSSLTRSLRRALEAEGYRLQEAMDWSLVAEEVALFGADLALVSRRLPGSDALHALHKLKRERGGSRCAVIVLLNQFDAAEIETLLTHGADDVLVGPIVPADLLNRVRLSVRARFPDMIELPEFALSSADELAPFDDDDAPRVRGLPEGLPSGLDGHYESDLATLIEVSEAMASSFPVEDALYVLVRRLGQAIPVSRCNVVVRGTRGDEIVVLASHDDANLRSHVLQRDRYPEIRRCLELGEIVLIEDVHADRDMSAVMDFIRSVDLRSALVVPLYVRDVVVGALSLTSRREAHGFTRRELLLVRAMANMAAGIIASSDAIERVRRAELAGKPPMEDLDEIVLGLDDQIEGLIEELERK